MRSYNQNDGFKRFARRLAFSRTTVCLAIAAAFLCRQTTARSEAIEDLKPFLKKQTLAVALVNPGKVNTRNVVTFIDRIANQLTHSESKERTAQWESALNRWFVQWNEMGGGVFYWVMDLPESYALPGYMVFPIPDGVSSDKAREVVSRLPGAREARVVGEAIVAGKINAGEQGKLADSGVPERWRSGLTAEKDAAITTTVIPSAAYKRALVELLPPLPDRFGGRSPGGIAGSISRLHATVETTPEIAFTVTVETANAPAARDTLNVMVEALSPFSESSEKRDQVERAERIRNLVTARVSGSKLRLQLSEAQAFRFFEALILPPLEGARTEAQRIKCVNNLKRIGLALRLYASDHDGNYPDTLKELKNYLNTVKVLLCPTDDSKPGLESLSELTQEEQWERVTLEQITYEYYGQGMKRDTPEEERPRTYLTRCPVHGNWGDWDGAVFQRGLEGND